MHIYVSLVMYSWSSTHSYVFIVIHKIYFEGTKYYFEGMKYCLEGTKYYLEGMKHISRERNIFRENEIYFEGTK